VLEVDWLAQSMTQTNRALARYQSIIAELGHQPSTQALLNWIAQQTLQAVEAQAAIVYSRNDGYLIPDTLQFDTANHRLRSRDLNKHLLDSPDIPAWLRQALVTGRASISLGFDKAGDFQPLLSELGAPRVNLLAIALNDRRGELLGMWVLLQREDALDGDAGIRSEQCVAFSEAVAAIAARHLESRQEATRHEKGL